MNTASGNFLVAGSAVCRAVGLAAAVVFALFAAGSSAIAAEGPARPNVVLIMTDDQGFGDVGFHGNSKIHTPRLDRLARESAELQWFYVSPVCAPTRASLLTGRYNYRTGVVDTNMGRALMYPDEVTLAEQLAAAGYRTGIFGKWHLGDNYPLRAIDQGFAEALVHRGGGIGQPSDPPGNSYFDPILEHNGEEERTRGYCSDIFTDAAIRFIGQSDDQPFFAYVAYNCPHVPLEVAEKYSQPYVDAGLDAETAKVYGMISNIDENIGRLLEQLKLWGKERDTIVVFLTDNGPQGKRFNAGLRDAKTTLYEGGIRVPCLIRWPGRIRPGRRIQQLTAHIDLMPTLLEACGVHPPQGVQIDGRSLLGLLESRPIEWPDRTLFIQFHRGDRPELFRGFAARSGRYKLVQPVQGDPAQVTLKPEFQLYDLARDPGEETNLIAERTQPADDLKAQYEAWFQDVSATRGYAPPRIVLGSVHENPSTLTRQDWRGPKAGWQDDSIGHWDVDVAAAGEYDITFRMPSTREGAAARFKLAGVAQELQLDSGSRHCTFKRVKLPTGHGRLECSIEYGLHSVGPHYVEVLCHEPAAAAAKAPAAAAN